MDTEHLPESSPRLRLTEDLTPDRMELLTMGLGLTPAERFKWLVEAVEALTPWLGLAQKPTAHR